MIKKTTKKITIMITGIGGGGVGEQILKAVKMASTCYRIIGSDVNKFNIGFCDVDVAYVIPLASDPSFLPALLNICKKEKVQVLIPGSEPELKKISENRKEFEKLNILLLINDPKVIRICMNKWETYKYFKKNNLNCPESVLIKRENDVEKIKKLPVIIKPAEGGHGSVNAFIAQNKEELVFILRYLLSQNIVPLVQEYIGSPNEEYTAGVLTDFKGKLVGSIVIKKIVQGALSSKTKIRNKYPEKLKDEFFVISSGISQGIIDDWPDVKKYAEKVAFKLGSRGPLNIQCRKTKKGIFAFEVNPRLSATTSLRALAGYNEPDILIRHYILGEKIKKPRYKKGVILRGLREEFLNNRKIKNI